MSVFTKFVLEFLMKRSLKHKFTVEMDFRLSKNHKVWHIKKTTSSFSGVRQVYRLVFLEWKSF